MDTSFSGSAEEVVSKQSFQVIQDVRSARGVDPMTAEVKVNALAGE